MIAISTRIAVILFLLRACFGANSGLPLFFEPNQGQAPPHVRFLASGGDHAIFLTDRELVLKSQDAAPVKVRLVGARNPRATQGQEPTSGVSNYIFGSDPSKWRLGVPHFSRVQYDEVYPGINLVFHSRDGRLEYDFLVSPGADTTKIQLEIEGTSSITLDDDGNLLLHTGSGVLRQEKPAVYQETAGERVQVDAQFVLSSSKHVAIRISDYDRGAPLIIDPVISFSATLGQAGGQTTEALGPTGNVYIINASTPLAPPRYDQRNQTESDVKPGSVHYLFRSCEYRVGEPKWCGRPRDRFVRLRLCYWKHHLHFLSYYSGGLPNHRR